MHKRRQPCLVSLAGMGQGQGQGQGDLGEEEEAVV